MKLFNLVKIRVCKYLNYKSNIIEGLISKVGVFKNKNESGILIEGLLRTPKNNVEKIIIASFLSNKYDISVDVILKHCKINSNKNFRLYNDFKTNSFFSLERSYFNPLFILNAVYKTILFFIQNRKVENLVNYKCNTICIGDLIYDSIIRENPKCYTVNKLSIKLFPIIFRAHIYLFFYMSVFNKNKYKYLITSHKTYIQYGILCKVAEYYGCIVILKDMNLLKIYSEDKGSVEEHIMRPDLENVNNILNNSSDLAELYIKNRFNGSANNMDIDVISAFKNKVSYNKADLLNLFNLNDDKLICFVLPHAFSDSPHVGKDMIYNDYYQWLKSTLKCLSKNKNIHVFVKPHPTSYCWGESGAVEQLLNEMNIDNIYIAPHDLNTSVVPDVSDIIITCQGTIGLECIYFGTPSITCASGYYSGFGVTEQFYSKYEYESFISNFSIVPIVNNEQKLLASAILYAEINSRIHSSCVPFDDILPMDDYENEEIKLWERINLLSDSYLIHEDPLLDRIKAI